MVSRTQSCGLHWEVEESSDLIPRVVFPLPHGPGTKLHIVSLLKAFPPVFFFIEMLRSAHGFT